MRYPSVTLGRGVAVGRGTRIIATDGGRLIVGDRTTIGRNATLIVKKGTLSIGSEGFVGDQACIAASSTIDIKSGALIAERVTIRD